MVSGDSIFCLDFLFSLIMIVTVQQCTSLALQTVGRTRPFFGRPSLQRFSKGSSQPHALRFSSVCKMTIADTALGTEKGAYLLDGLDVYSVPASGDHHPLTVYGRQQDINGLNKNQESDGTNILLMLHGRTWSSVPVYHLLGGPKHKEAGAESRSLMEELQYDHNVINYAMDFRGFGGTPKDSTGCVVPNRCVEDVESVLAWITEKHPNAQVHLMGWSQGALVAQLAGQRKDVNFSKLILYGSIFDPRVRYPREPLFVRNKENATDIENTYDAAVEDFTIEGTILPDTAQYFAEAALLADPIKARWAQLHQFNNCDPARVHVPTLVVAGDQDPYGPLHVQQELFCNLARGTDRSWHILTDADHAVHLLAGRSRFANVVASFLQNGN